jgi:hypothetical protein
LNDAKKFKFDRGNDVEGKHWTENLPRLNVAKLGAIHPAVAKQIRAANEVESGRLPHIHGDIRHQSRAHAHFVRDQRRVKTAVELIGQFPEPDEAIHTICSGRFALWDVIPAVLEIVRPATITALHIATLGFSKANVVAMSELLDAGSIGRISLLCSHYFKGTSNGIFEQAQEALTKRGQRFLSARTHAKLLAAKLTDGRTLIVEASANLRSCKNMEQMSFFGSRALYAFHVGWIDELFMQGGFNGPKAYPNGA